MRNASITHAYRIPVILAFLAIAAILAFTTIMTVSAQAQGPDWKQPPTGLSVTAGAQPGEIEIVWDPHPQSSKTLSDYRVTWTPDGAAFQPQNRPRWNAYPTTNEITIDTNQPGAIHQVKVRARYDDGKTSNWSDVISGQAAVTPNSPATGEPAITGTAEIEETLTATTSGITDGNGLTNTTFNHQWVRSANGADSDVTDATGPTYVVTADDVDSTIKVRVSFTDDDGYSETLTSNATASVPEPPIIEGTPVLDSWSLIPAGLTTGDQFRLIFLSSTTRNASSSNIADYNAFIQNRAAAGHDDIQAYSNGFSVVGCTAAVDARENTDTTGLGVPIYWLGGNKVADGYTDFYDGNWHDEVNDKGHDDIQAYSNGFSVVGCTAAVDARENTDTTGIGVPIYWLGGAKVADGYTDFYDGNWHDEVNDKDESGANGPDTSQFTNQPFTGCDDDGTEAFNSALSAALGNPTGYVHTGSPDGNNSNTGPISGFLNPSSTNTRPYYGLSAVFTVAGAPEVTVEVDHDWSLIPSGMNAGDKFRLIFLSSNKRDATDTAIDVYNTWIQTQVAAGHADIQAYSDGFTVVGCTEDDDARDNTGTTYTRANKGVPIHWMNGTKVADNYQDFYDGSWDDESDDRNESGNDAHDTFQFDNLPFTGCKNDGTEDSAAGSTALGNVTVSIGRLGIGAPINSPATDAHPFYGMSAVFTVGEAPEEPTQVDHDWSLIPSGLGAGDQFRLIFLSSNKRDAGSSDIDVYNTWIQSQVTAGHAAIQDYSADFRAVACTADDDGRDNTRTRHDSGDRGVPIYWVNGTKVADDYQDFYDGTWDDEINDKDESGTDGPDTSQIDNHPFTGCADNGTQAFNSSLSAALGNPTGYVRAGSPDGNNSNTGPISGTFNPSSADTRPLYGLSDVFTVGEAPTETAVEGDAVATPVLDSWSLIPAGLTTGDQFRLIFLSSTTRNASSSNIADYNAFIQDRAAAGHGDIQAHSGGFTAVACTEAVHARNNTATNFTSADKGVPIYWLGGDRAADDYEDFYDGAWDDEINDKDESGANGPDTSQAANHPWTGCAGDGTQAFNSELSATLGNATGYIRTGLPNSNSNSVNTGPISGPYNPASTDNRPVYGLSAVFTVTEGTPEETAVLGTPILDTSALVPTELTAGDQFRLIFLSSTKRNASSSSIGTYNTFIQDRAAVGHADIQEYSDGFTAVGCTAAVDARDNTGTSYTSVNKGVPIYWLGGTRVADDYEDFYDGSWNDEEKSKDESGANGPDISQTANHPWTGCADNGSEGFNSHISVALGNPTGFVRTGLPDGNNVNTGPISGPYNPASTETRPLYGLSAVFTVADLSDATLSILSLAQDGPITLTPAFDPATTGYTAEVANTVETISLTALQNHDGATVSVMDSDGNSITDTAQIDLGYGENIISIVVTAQNGTTKVTYQVTVTRGFAWNSTMTVGERLTAIPQASGYTIWGENMGSLSTEHLDMEGPRRRVLNLMKYAGGLWLNIDRALPGDFTLTLDGQDFLASDSAEPPTPADGRYWWKARRINWTSGDSVKVSIVPVPGSESLPPRELAPPIAQFKNVPEGHNGSDTFSFELNFSAEVSVISETLEEYAFNVTNGSMEKAERDQAGSNMSWTITVKPDSQDDVEVRLRATKNCSRKAAICTSDGRMLFNTTEFTVSGPSTP